MQYKNTNIIHNKHYKNESNYKKMTIEEKTKTSEITFKCRFCGRLRPLSEMMILARFFPPMVACQDCENHMQALSREEEPPVNQDIQPLASEGDSELTR